MEQKIEDILRRYDLKEWQIEDLKKELLNLHGVSKNEVSLKCEDCKCELPKGMKNRCYECYDEIYFP